MSLLSELSESGVNVNEGLDRLMGNAALYERMLGSFVKMMKTMEVQPDFDNTNYADIIEKTHTIKGTSGNLSITPVYEAYSEIVRLLRADQPEEAKAVMQKIIPIQDKIIKCIEKYVQ